MTPCAHKFVFECTAWQWFAVITTVVSFIAGISLSLLGLTGWTLVLHTGIVAGCATCTFWWIWAMIKFRHMAIWWLNLNTQLTLAVELLAEAKQDIKEIKKTVKQDNSLFG